MPKSLWQRLLRNLFHAYKKNRRKRPNYALPFFEILEDRLAPAGNLSDSTTYVSWINWTGANGGAPSHLALAGPSDETELTGPEPVALEAPASSRADAKLILAQAVAKLARLDTYQVKMQRRERVGGVVQPEEDILLSIKRKERLRLKVRLEGDDAAVESITAVWPSANFFERELFDLFGIRFLGHPYLRRIMMPEDWQAFLASRLEFQREWDRITGLR